MTLPLRWRQFGILRDVVPDLVPGRAEIHVEVLRGTDARIVVQQATADRQDPTPVLGFAEHGRAAFRTEVPELVRAGASSLCEAPQLLVRHFK